MLYSAMLGKNSLKFDPILLATEYDKVRSFQWEANEKVWWE